ncbi:hypothetical protein E2K98_27410 [Bacillus salipaludis]|uniref:Uncharacterized protein n=1 Tax=Bacillus salipaludis TaxID=2547811 RepID=A0A4R5VIJ6_9BACI|nr:hypothetical protein [Bacillus salipaludis]MDQ6598933.1 hypothetical protein [Bacillus salipaludis]TDK56206.1 hypothetical protein E2K98_27410 [Bacillus salipaludis]
MGNFLYSAFILWNCLLSYKSINDKITTELQMSDAVVNKDLLRFYTPKGFKPIDLNNYQSLGPSGITKQPKVQTTGAE